MGKRILVVDDDENILNLEKTILEQKGFDVTTAAGGAEALTLLEEGNFDLVLLDATAVSEPSSLWLLAAALGGLGFRRRRGCRRSGSRAR